MSKLSDLVREVTDEKSFVRFLHALREDVETHERDCTMGYWACVQEDHWETRSIGAFLKSAANWGEGDFADGEHGSDPILRRVATMLYVGRHLLPEDRPY
jgi:hypothetical protein